jgi:site-specific DNA-methyltransferase (adenine-specific)
MDGGGNGSSAIPDYQKFVSIAKRMKPYNISMIMPAKWYNGGRGLEQFRKKMLNDKHLKCLYDFIDGHDCFPNVDIAGGVCYFLWETDYSGPCVVTTIRHGIKTELKRPLLEGGCDSFVRFNEAIPIIRKIISKNFISLENTISARKPFGDIKVSSSGDIKVYAYPTNGHIRRSLILQNVDWIDKYKVMIAKAYGERGEFPYLILGKPFIGEPKSCCTETYLVLGSFQTIEEARSLESYVKTKFFRFLVLLKKNTQNAARGVYSFVPLQDFSHPWTDEMLYKKYGLTEDEIAFIESMIRPME